MLQSNYFLARPKTEFQFELYTTLHNALNRQKNYILSEKAVVYVMRGFWLKTP